VSAAPVVTSFLARMLFEATTSQGASIIALLLSLLTSDMGEATGVLVDSSSLGISSIVSSEGESCIVLLSSVTAVEKEKDLDPSILIIPDDSRNDRFAEEDKGESGGGVMKEFPPVLVPILRPVLELIVSVVNDKDSVR